MGLKILHLSDFHFAVGQPYDAELVKTALLDHLRYRVREGNGPNAIFITGDVVYSGRPEEFLAASEFLDALLQVAEINKARLFVVPGNHDVDRTELRSLVRSLDTQSEADDVFCANKDVLHISLGQRAYRDWYDSYFDGIDTFSLNSSCSRPRLLDVNGTRLAVIGINSAVYSRDEHDAGKLWIGRRCIAEARTAVEALNCHSRVALMHHPLEWLHEAEQASIKAAVFDAFDVLCSGHLHETDYSDTRAPSGHCLRIVAGAAYQAAPWPRRANWLTFSDATVEIEPIRFEETPVPVWTIDPSVFPHDAGYKRTLHLPVRHKAMVPAAPSTSQLASKVQLSDDPSLFRAPDGTPIYVEPRIYDLPQAAMADDLLRPNRISIEDISLRSVNTVIHCPIEHGATQLARRLAEAVRINGSEVIVDTASSIPNYDRKLRDYFKAPGGTAPAGVLIIDDFIASRDGRMLKELDKAKIFTRFIALAKSSSLSATVEPLPELESGQVEELHLWGLDRPRVRSVAEQIFTSSSVDHISAAVEKTYGDLLGLAIPLTPANVIMYLHILWKENDFQPLDRVNILERYMHGVLSSPSDAFAGAFNVKNKIALAAAFVKRMFDSGKTVFQVSDWNEFCRDYSARTLITFDAASVFRVFEAARVFIAAGRTYHLRYGFLYSYFVALAVANRPSELRDFADNDKFYSLASLVEAVSAASTDNSFLLRALTGKLDGFIEQFYAEYITESFDPLINAQWPDAENEQEALWEPIKKEIAQGPVEAEKIDSIKSSLVAEARSLNQQVVLRRFTEMEQKLFSSMTLLEEALKNSDDVDGQLKIAALRTLYRGYLVVLQIGSLLSGVLATRRIFRWGGLLFANTNADLDRPEDLVAGFSPWVVPALNESISEATMDKLGSKKLGSLFMSYSLTQDLPEFESALNLCLIVRTKPPGWGSSVERIIKSIDRRQYRLLLILRVLRSDFRQELNTHQDREELKRLIALIEAKRSTNSNSPGNKAVGRMLNLLEQKRFFEATAEKAISEPAAVGALKITRKESPDP